jgi:hypothetical protein
MRKPTAPHIRNNRHASSRKQYGLIAQGSNAQHSATADSVLDNHSHRTEIGLNCLKRFVIHSSQPILWLSA